MIAIVEEDVQMPNVFGVKRQSGADWAPLILVGESVGNPVLCCLNNWACASRHISLVACPRHGHSTTTSLAGLFRVQCDDKMSVLEWGHV